MLMSGIVRSALSAAVSFGVAWGGSIFYWRSSGTTPNGMEMLTYLGILPASLLGGSWLLRDMGRRSLSRATDAADSAAAKAVEHSDSKAAAASSSSPEAPPASGARPALLAGAVNLSLGQQPQAILALRGNLPRPVLHKQFRDRDGLPVFVAQVPDLAASDVAEARLGHIGRGRQRAPA